MKHRTGGSSDTDRMNVGRIRCVSFRAIGLAAVLAAVSIDGLSGQGPRGLDVMKGTIEELVVSGHRAFVIRPLRPRVAPRPWVLFEPTDLNPPESDDYPTLRHQWLFDELLARGVTVAGLAVDEPYGTPASRALLTTFYQRLVGRYALSTRPCLVAQSRGALTLYNWAIDHPRSVACVAAIYPVTDMRTWPKDLGSASAAYGLPLATFRRRLPEFNPVDRLAPLAREHVPVFHLHGDRDTDVPPKENSLAFAERYRQNGGEATVVILPGKRHEEVDDFFESAPLRDFLLHALGVRASGR